MIVGIVTLAFWINSQRQLSHIMVNTYIPHADIFLTKEQESTYTKLLRSFSTEFGIHAKLFYENGTPIPQYEDTNLVFILEPINKKGYIVYPPLLKKLLSKEERATFDVQLSQIVLSRDWKEHLLPFIYDFYLILSSRIA